MMRAEYISDDRVRVTIADGESLILAEPRAGDAGFVLPPGVYACAPEPGLHIWDALVREGVVPAPPPAIAPDGPTLSDFRVGLTLWTGADGTPRIDAVTQRIADSVARGDPLGRIARERFEYGNTVSRTQLLQLRAMLGFTEAEVEESLWRAAQVARGDLSGTWPLQAA